MEALEEGNVDEEELEDLDEKLEMDYQIGEDLKERVRFSDLFSLLISSLTCMLINPF